jgi:uncharacterized protein
MKMRFSPALILIACLASPVWADDLDGWCAQVKLPSSIALCSDRELRALMVERQHAFEAARAKVGEERAPVLIADQNAWVASYPKACGLVPDTPPPIPLPPNVKDCMASAGRARIAYLKAYGTPSPAPSQTAAYSSTTIGPSFDCSKATEPLPRMICSNPGLSRIDVHFAQAYWALRQQLRPEQRSELAEEDLNFLNSVLLACGVPETGVVSGSPDCVAAQYNDQRVRWASRLTGVAAEEARRPPEQHLLLQRDLQALGFLPNDEGIDGVYGPATRGAISAWQTGRDRPATGFIGDDDARALSNEVAGRATPEASPTPNIAALGQVPPSQSAPTFPPAEANPLNEVPLKPLYGTYRVPVRINDAFTLNFTLDSGAADVQIPADVMLTLMRTETLTPADFIGKETYQLADGSELPSMTVMLRELKVGDHRLQNVKAAVGPVAGGLLLGQSFLARFKSWTLDNDRHVLVLVEH